MDLAAMNAVGQRPAELRPAQGQLIQGRRLAIASLLGNRGLPPAG